MGREILEIAISRGQEDIYIYYTIFILPFAKGLFFDRRQSENVSFVLLLHRFSSPAAPDPHQLRFALQAA